MLAGAGDNNSSRRRELGRCERQRGVDDRCRWQPDANADQRMILLLLDTKQDIDLLAGA